MREMIRDPRPDGSSGKSTPCRRSPNPNPFCDRCRHDAGSKEEGAVLTLLIHRNIIGEFIANLKQLVLRCTT